MSPSCENFITLISIRHILSLFFFYILSLKEHKTFAYQKKTKLSPQENPQLVVEKKTELFIMRP